MKFEKGEAENTFIPYTLKITLESKEEEVALCNIFSHELIIQATGIGSEFHSGLSLMDDNVNSFEDFNNKLKELFLNKEGNY